MQGPKSKLGSGLPSTVAQGSAMGMAGLDSSSPSMPSTQPCKYASAALCSGSSTAGAFLMGAGSEVAGHWLPRLRVVGTRLKMRLMEGSLQLLLKPGGALCGPQVLLLRSRGASVIPPVGWKSGAVQKGDGGHMSS